MFRQKFKIRFHKMKWKNPTTNMQTATTTKPFGCRAVVDYKCTTLHTYKRRYISIIIHAMQMQSNKTAGWTEKLSETPCFHFVNSGTYDNGTILKIWVFRSEYVLLTSTFTIWICSHLKFGRLQSHFFYLEYNYVLPEITAGTIKIF